MTAPAESKSKLPTAWIAGLLAAIVAAAFSPSLLNDFVDYDDSDNFVNNTRFRGLGLAQLRWMVTTFHIGHWIPVTWLTFGLDYTLWGMNPLGYHLTNVVIHAIAAALVYVVALRLLGTASWSVAARHTGAVAGALFWALHPLRAESVAWITERRDVLSTTLFLLAILLYLRAHDAHAPRRRFIGFSLAVFALAIASKSMVMTLPAVLLILDVYPLRRIGFTRERWQETRAVLVEKAPYLVLGLAATALGYWGQKANHYFTPYEHYPWTARIAIAGYAYAFYVWKTIIPIGLSPLYELPARVGLTDMQFAGAWAAVIALTLVAVALRRRLPVVPAAWAYYLVTLAPVSGLAHAGYQIANDRYTYLPSLGFALLAAVGVAALVHNQAAVRRRFVQIGVASVAALLVMLAALTWGQVQTWRNTEVLWMYAVDSEPTCAICHANLAAWLTDHGNAAGAIHEYGIALALRPDRTGFHSSLGIVLLNENRIDEALAQFEKRRAARPNDVANLVAMGTALMRKEQPREAEQVLARALALAPRHPVGRASHANALALLDRRDDALQECQRAVDLDGENAIVRYICGRLRLRYKDPDGARAHLEQLGRLDLKLASRLAGEMAYWLPRL